MENWGNWWLVIVALSAIYVVVVFIMNRFFPHGNKAQILNQPPSLPEELDTTLNLTCWNIGYGGLGEESDFITDGGKNRLPPSPRTVKKNLNGILAQLGIFKNQSAPHVFLLQEVSKRSPLSFWQPVRGAIISLFADHFVTFRPDISTRGLPWPLAINHGTMTLAPAHPQQTQVIRLPTEPTFLAGLIKRNYGLLVTRFAIKNSPPQWVIVNLHLAAFDPKGATRYKQLEQVFDFARSEYEKGNFVIMGGDWNMALAKSDFPHTTNLKQLFWLVDLPRTLLPKGWKIACDATTPTVRTNYQPYVAGENYTGIIDGFIISPNVSLHAIHTTDTKFIHTDHMPVTATFSTNPTPKG